MAVVLLVDLLRHERCRALEAHNGVRAKFVHAQAAVVTDGSNPIVILLLVRQQAAPQRGQSHAHFIIVVLTQEFDELRTLVGKRPGLAQHPDKLPGQDFQSRGDASKSATRVRVAGRGADAVVKACTCGQHGSETVFLWRVPPASAVLGSA